jgi:uncharacterized protein with NRDE domain
MCILLFAHRVHPDYPLVLLANRDEFHAREALPAHAWQDTPGLIGGRDLSAGGTWLGATLQGRFAALTNYRDFRLPMPENPPSRGELVTGFLQSENPEAWLRALEAKGHHYAGFNLLASDGERLWHISNQGSGLTQVEPGLHGLSNALLNTPWPKVTKGKQALGQRLQVGLSQPDAFFDLLADRSPGADDQLPDTGRDLDFERRVSPIYILDPVYGTRCSTLFLQGIDGSRKLLERTFDPEGRLIGKVELELPATGTPV